MSAECGQTCLLALLTLLLLRLLLFDKYNYRAVEVEDHSTLKYGEEIRGHSLPVRLVCGSKYSGSFHLCSILTSMSQIEVVVSHIRLYIVTFGIMYSIFFFIFQCTVLEEVGRVGGLSLYTMEQHRVEIESSE